METFLPVVIAFIFVLAILGIVAGVSNDATNFMSAPKNKMLFYM